MDDPRRIYHREGTEHGLDDGEVYVGRDDRGTEPSRVFISARAVSLTRSEVIALRDKLTEWIGDGEASEDAQGDIGRTSAEPGCLGCRTGLPRVRGNLRTVHVRDGNPWVVCTATGVESDADGA